MMLNDAPGGQRLIASIVDAAANFALIYAGTPDDSARAHLEGFRALLEAKLAPAVGVETATQMADAFVKAVMGEKHELEAKGGGSA